MTHPNEAVDISREACESEFPNTKHPHGEMIMALRAALDRAEADKAAAVDAERAACTDEMRLALAAAVAGERERCAMIAKMFDTVLVDTSGGTWKIQPTFDAVAAAIREAPQ